MTSRSFDHRLLLLFFPGHETHSIHCERFWGYVKTTDELGVTRYHNLGSFALIITFVSSYPLPSLTISRPCSLKGHTA